MLYCLTTQKVLRGSHWSLGLGGGGGGVKSIRKEMFYRMMHSTHFMYGYMASDIW